MRLAVPPDGLAYRRRFEAKIDVVAEDRLLVRGRLKDHRVAIEHTWTLRTPRYEVVTARASSATVDLPPQICTEYADIAGVSIGRGFTQRVREALAGESPWRDEHVQLAIEMARVGQQIFQFPADFESRFPLDRSARSAQALRAWQQDRAYLPGLANSCFTYSDDQAATLSTQEVVCHVGPAQTRPPLGTRGAFRRQKRLTIEPMGESALGYACENHMQDDLHDIRLRLRIGADGLIEAASASSPRLPYDGLCQTPQARLRALEGQRLDAEGIRILAAHQGGSTGCTHLFDLAADCLRLFAW